LWAEQVATGLAVGAQVIPSPPESGALCDLAIECLDEDLPRLRQALDEAGIRYGVWLRRSGGDDGSG
jgi:Putative Se/S carrier protein-like